MLKVEVFNLEVKYMFPYSGETRTEELADMELIVPREWVNYSDLSNFIQKKLEDTEYFWMMVIIEYIDFDYIILEEIE